MQFKNLSKKDSTTKSKALEELLVYVSRDGDAQAVLEDGFIDAWVKVFPRLSIDASRRVRQLAFTLQKSVSKASGKRIAKHMPLIAPAWVAGTHDGDKGVSRAAQDGLQSMFATAKKQRNLRKAYQPHILAFGTDVVENETKDSVSDPKSTTTEDAEAVYNRVLASSINSISEMLQMLDGLDLEPVAASYEALLHSSKLYDTLANGDATARRAIYTFIRTCFARLPHHADRNVSKLAKALLTKRTIRHQTGTSHLLVEVLTLLTSRDAEIWTQEGANENLRQVVKLGSQSGSAQFWVNLAQLYDILPDQVLPREYDEVTKSLEAIHAGITKKDEPRSNQLAAYRCYLKALDKLCENLAPEDNRKTAKESGLQLVQHYIKPSPETSSWQLAEQYALQILTEALRSELLQSVLADSWPSYADGLLQDLQMSLPAQSKDFEQSQAAVESQGRRLFSVQSQIGSDRVSDVLGAAFANASSEVAKKSVELLESREGKPFGRSTHTSYVRWRAY